MKSLPCKLHDPLTNIQSAIVHATELEIYEFENAGQ